MTCQQLTIVLITTAAAPLAAEEPTWHTGAKFRTAIHEPFTASWKNVELREVLLQIQRQTGVAILLDRRIDPNAMPEVKFTGKPLRQGLSDLAEQLGAGISIPDNVIYVGPPDACQKLRTLIALREAETPVERVGGPRRKPRTIRWDDLTEPRDIVLDLARDDWPFTNLDLIEHDLWAAAVLPAVDFETALSLLLIQFDMTYSQRDGEIQLVPIPDEVRIERAHTLKGKNPDALFAEWKQRWPKLRLDRTVRQVKVSATVESHEEIAGEPGKGMVWPNAALARREFTLTIKDVPARDLMAELEKSGIQFDYDANALADAGIDLGQFIELDVENLPAAKFFEAIFEPLGVRSEIDGTTVKLVPMKK